MSQTNKFDDKNILAIDEQICALMKERKEILKNKTSCPSEETIAEWAKKYGLYEDQLTSIFLVIRNEKHFQPMVVPTDFQKRIPVFQYAEIEDTVYTITFISQYANSSVVHFNTDQEECNDENEISISHDHYQFFELDLGKDFSCRDGGGSGSNGHSTHKYIITPPLPNDLSGIEFNFKEVDEPYNAEPTGFEFTIKLK